MCVCVEPLVLCHLHECECINCVGLLRLDSCFEAISNTSFDWSKLKDQTISQILGVFGRGENHFPGK